jgi:uncharacterized protein
MNEKLLQRVAVTLNIPAKQVAKTLVLLQEGGTVPFISRYRKEVTGNLDEVQIGKIKQAYEQGLEFEKRKETILKAIDEQGKLTDVLRKVIEECLDPTTLEDLYLPYKQKRTTKAELARKNGLEPLAKIIMSQRELHVEQRATQFLSDEITSVDDALQGAREIIAEWINENQAARENMRELFRRQAVITSNVVKGKGEGAEKYKDYFTHEEKLERCKSHRLLAMRRGEKEGYLKISVRPPETEALVRLHKLFIKNDLSGDIALAIKDGYKRLLAPSIENEFATLSKQQADEEAIAVFAENLKQLLLGSPLGEKRILAIDPGFRTGCKLVCLDQKGDLLHNETIYPHPPQSQSTQAMHKIITLVEQYKIEALAIGNGTAGRETEQLIRKTRFKSDVQVFVVNEAGASIYSASSVAREEFPDYDVTVRGAVSIGRRLMDPLAELVKIDAKSIGVGQYQHDVDQKTLKESLDSVVEHCVNGIGVDVNTASKHLLTYVSGLGPQLAQNIVDYRKENGAFPDRKALKKVPRMGDKAFEQSAGFLRVRNGVNPLDNSAVHPERYSIVNQMAKKAGVSVAALIGNQPAVEQIDFNLFENEEIGSETLEDIRRELLKPGVDPRQRAKVFEFAKGLHRIEDLQAGMFIPGIVTNITNFGAFVDVGVKQDGLVHISNLADEYVSNPADVVSLNQQLMVKVLEVDVARKRVGLSLKTK